MYVWEEAAYLFDRHLFRRREWCKFISRPACSENHHPDKISSKKWRFYFQCVAWDYWRLWLHAADLFDRPSQVQPDSLHSNQRRENSSATSVEYVSCIHRKSLACLCEWNLKGKYQYYEQSQAITPYEAFFLYWYILCESSMDYLSISQSINQSSRIWRRVLLCNCRSQAAEPSCVNMRAYVS